MVFKFDIDANIYSIYNKYRVVIMSTLDNNILKELDRHLLNASIIGIIMNKVNSVDKKNKFLNYLINNRNIILNKVDVISYIKSELI